MIAITKWCMMLKIGNLHFFICEEQVDCWWIISTSTSSWFCNMLVKKTISDIDTSSFLACFKFRRCRPVSPIYDIEIKVTNNTDVWVLFIRTNGFDKLLLFSSVLTLDVGLLKKQPKSNRSLLQSFISKRQDSWKISLSSFVTAWSIDGCV